MNGKSNQRGVTFLISSIIIVIDRQVPELNDQRRHDKRSVLNFSLTEQVSLSAANPNYADDALNDQGEDSQ